MAGIAFQMTESIMTISLTHSRKSSVFTRRRSHHRLAHGSQLFFFAAKVTRRRDEIIQFYYTEKLELGRRNVKPETRSPLSHRQIASEIMFLRVFYDCNGIKCIDDVATTLQTSLRASRRKESEILLE